MMHRPFLALLAAPLLFLAGCMPRPDYRDLPTSAVISVTVTAQQEVPVANILAPTAAEKKALQQALADSAGGNGLRIRLRLPQESAPDLVKLRKSLAGLGIPPGITAVSARPSESSGSLLVVYHLAAVAPSCDSMITPSETIDKTKRPNISFGCATYTNLAASVADPADLAGGRELGLADGTTIDAAIERYQADKVKALSKNTATTAAPSTTN